jgi:hypothetical protein
VVGFGALRHLCALLRLEPPRLLKEERTLPHPVLLAGEVARQMRDEREALSERARLLLTIDTALAHVPDAVFRMLGVPERPRTGLDEAGTAAVLHATAAAFAERVAMPHRTGPVWSPTVITGYRAWGLGIKPEPDAGPRLFGAYGREWATGHLEASCDEDPLRPLNPAGRAGRQLHLLGPEGPEPPHLRHQCGIYAYKDLSPLLRFRVPLSSWTVLGRVEMWGKVIEHKHGYRAQHCRIVKAVVLAPRTRLLQAQWPELVRRFGDISRLPGVNHHTITHSWCGNCSDKIDLERNPQLKTEIRRALTP